ncbi:MAG: hypothetical protein ACE5LQ_04775 [Candidatus Bipolaricaulia bacterium]
MRRAILVLLLLVIFASFSAIADQEQVTEQDVYHYINYSLEVSAQTKATLLEAFRKGFADGAITPTRALQLLQRVNGSGAAIELREQVLLTIAAALLEEVPVEMLVSKVEEGLARGRPMEEILAEIQERKATLEEVKALLESKGFKVGIELQLGAITVTLSFELTGVVITDVAGALEDYVRNGNDPADSFAVRQAALLRLQRDRSVPAGVTEWIAASVSADELGRIARNIAGRLAEMERE